MKNAVLQLGMMILAVSPMLAGRNDRVAVDNSSQIASLERKLAADPENGELVGQLGVAYAQATDGEEKAAKLWVLAIQRGMTVRVPATRMNNLWTFSLKGMAKSMSYKEYAGTFVINREGMAFESVDAEMAFQIPYARMGHISATTASTGHGPNVTGYDGLRFGRGAIFMRGKTAAGKKVEIPVRLAGSDIHDLYRSGKNAEWRIQGSGLAALAVMNTLKKEMEPKNK